MDAPLLGPSRSSPLGWWRTSPLRPDGARPVRAVSRARHPAGGRHLAEGRRHPAAPAAPWTQALSSVVNWVLNALCLLLVAHLVTGFRVAGFGTALAAALVIGQPQNVRTLLVQLLDAQRRVHVGLRSSGKNLQGHRRSGAVISKSENIAGREGEDGLAVVLLGAGP